MSVMAERPCLIAMKTYATEKWWRQERRTSTELVLRQMSNVQASCVKRKIRVAHTSERGELKKVGLR